MKFEPPTIDSVKLYAAKIGLPEVEAERYYDFYTSNGWKVGRNPMKSPEAALRNWKRTYEERVQRRVNGSNNGADKIIWQREYDRVCERLRQIRSQYGDHQTWTKNDRLIYDRLVQRKKWLMEKLGIII